MLLVGFGHKARQGKNTAATAFLSACPIDSYARMYAYADALRAEVTKAIRQCHGQEQLIHGFQEAGLMAPWVTVDSPKPRTLYQWWGTDYRRKQDPDYWVKRLFSIFEREKPDIALVTDVRFPNEAEAIHKAGGYLVKVLRTTPPDVVVPAHPSELALEGYKGWDYTLTATTVTELRTKAAALYAEIRGKYDARGK